MTFWKDKTLGYILHTSNMRKYNIDNTIRERESSRSELLWSREIRFNSIFTFGGT